MIAKRGLEYGLMRKARNRSLEIGSKGKIALPANDKNSFKTLKAKMRFQRR